MDSQTVYVALGHIPLLVKLFYWGNGNRGQCSGSGVPDLLLFGSKIYKLVFRYIMKETELVYVYQDIPRIRNFLCSVRPSLEA